MGIHFERGRVLFEQSRFDLAEKELREELAGDPHSALAKVLLSLCLGRLDRDKEAEEQARDAVAAAPDLAAAHGALANALLSLGRLDDAEASAREAIRLDPENSSHRGLLAAVLMDSGRPGQALEAAEEGLALDPDDGACSNLRGMALVRLGRASEAAEGLDDALAKEPEDSLTHANQGWALLHAGDSRKAAEHFREALRLDPMDEWAREGMIEALKARNTVYALLLKYFLWMSLKSGKMQLGILIGGYIGFRLLKGMAKTNPSLAPFVMPLIVAYIVFAFMTWVADPLFNLTLMFDRFGRYLLSGSDRAGALLFGGCLLSALASAAAGLLVPWTPGIWLGIFFALAAFMSALVFRCPPGWRRAAMAAFGAVTAGSALAGGLLSDFSQGGITPKGPAGGLLLVALAGFVLSSWVANGLIISARRQ